MTDNYHYYITTREFISPTEKDIHFAATISRMVKNPGQDNEDIPRYIHCVPDQYGATKGEVFRKASQAAEEWIESVGGTNMSVTPRH